MATVKVVCNVLILREGRFLLVKEAKKRVYGKWNIPGGHMDVDENVFDTAVREAKEETGLDIGLDGLIGIYQHRSKNGDNTIKFLFSAFVKGGRLRYRKGELLDARWFSFGEFAAIPDGELRRKDMRTIVDDYHKRGAKPLDFINVEWF